MNKYAAFSKPRPAIENRRCLTKMVYRTEDRAELAAAHINSTLGVEQRPYHCPMCLRWHLTSNPLVVHDFRDRNGRPDEKNYGSNDWRSWQDRPAMDMNLRGRS